MTNKHQVELFHDTVYDALGADIAAAGGFKVVAGRLWPTDVSGPTKLRNAINPEQPHKLCADEIMAIKRLAREAGSTATIDYEAQQLGYTVTWLDPVNQAEELRRQLSEQLAEVSRKLDLIQRADERAERVRVVR